MSWRGIPKEGTGQEGQSPRHREFLDSHSKTFLCLLAEPLKPSEPISGADKSQH